jgi:hypothetical protein
VVPVAVVAATFRKPSCFLQQRLYAAALFFAASGKSKERREKRKKKTRWLKLKVAATWKETRRRSVTTEDANNAKAATTCSFQFPLL